MDKSELITEELNGYVEKAGKNPLTKGALTPIRLCLAWMREINQRLKAIENTGGQNVA